MNTLLLLIAFLGAHGSGTLFAAADSPGMQPRNKLATSRSARVARQREAEARFELARGSEEDWAGSYEFGDGKGSSFSIVLAPKAGFVLFHEDFSGLRGLSYGKVVDEGDRIILEVESSTELAEPLVLCTEVYPVLWGQRRYLVFANDMQRFVADMADGAEPRRSRFGSYFMTIEFYSRQIKDRPRLSAAWNGLLLEKPLQGNVIEVKQLEDTKPGDDYRGPIKLTLSIGSEAGVREHMRLFLHEQFVWLVGRVTRVEPERCVVEVTLSRNSEPPPREGWRASTSDPAVTKR